MFNCVKCFTKVNVYTNNMFIIFICDYSLDRVLQYGTGLGSSSIIAIILMSEDFILIR